MRLSHVEDSLSNGRFLSDAKGYVRGVFQRLERNPRTLSVLAAGSKLLGIRPTLEYAEVHLCDHCNLKCKGCSHFSSLSPAVYADLDSFEDDMKQLRRLFKKVLTLRLMGGEPLLHPEVEKFMQAAREILPETNIALVTNGMLLMKMGRSFWGCAARNDIRIDVSGYPIRIDYPEIQKTAERHGVALRVEQVIESFSTYPLTEQATQNAAKQFTLCRTMKDCPYVENGRIYLCATVPLSRILNDSFGTDFTQNSRDSLVLRDTKSGWDVLEFLSHSCPWCAHCTLDRSTTYRWDRTGKDKDEWIL